MLQMELEGTLDSKISVHKLGKKKASIKDKGAGARKDVVRVQDAYESRKRGGSKNTHKTRKGSQGAGYFAKNTNRHCQSHQD